jgi:EmrB/QacA subfamily drug resistance transporter
VAEPERVSSEPGRGLSRRLAALVAVAYFMEILDGTIVATAAPDMARSLGVRPAEISVSITAYLLTVAVLVPVSGWVADRWGSRTVFVVAIAVFTVASGLCAASTSLLELVVLRLVQGAGGALMVPVGRLVVLRGTAKRDIIRAIAFLTWPALAAPVAAPLLGGLLTTYLSWHWIFLVNVPVGVLLAAGALVLVPQIRRSDRTPMDWSGFALTAACLAALVIATSELGEADADPRVVVIGLAAAVALGIAAARHLLGADHPLLDLRVFRIGTFRVAHVSGSVYRATVYAVPFVLPLMLQVGFGWSAVHAGALVMLVFVGNLAIKPATTPLLHRFPFRAVIVVASTILAATMALCAVLTPATPLVLAGALLLVSGAARSVGFSAYVTLGFADIDDAQMSSANTVSAAVQQLAGGFGVALGAVGIQLLGTLGPATSSPILPYRWTFVMLALITLTVTWPASRLGRDAGHQLRSR